MFSKMQIQRNIALTLILLSALGCTKDKKLQNTHFKEDSIAMRKEYDSMYFLNSSNLKSVYKHYETSKDSIIIGLNNQLYSDYLVRNTKYDSAYYYLKLADGFFKNDTTKLFLNSFKKIYLTNRIGLLTQSEIEFEKNIKLNIKDQKLKKLYQLIFSLPIQEEKDSALYKKSINTVLNFDQNTHNKLKKYRFLENYATNQTNKYLQENKEFTKILERSSKRLKELQQENKTKEDRFFTNLYYVIVAKTYLNDNTIQDDFKLFEKHIKDVFTKETEALFYVQKARYFETKKNTDSANVYYLKALDISKKTGNFIYERDILKSLLISQKKESKENMASFIKINDSLLTYKSYIDDFIFSTNSKFFELKSEQKAIKKNNFIALFLVFVVFFSIILYFFIIRNKQKNKLAKKHQEYLDEKAKMYRYLIDIKERMDINILKENTNIKTLIYTNTIAKIDVILDQFSQSEIDIEQLQQNIKEVEDESRKISHIISSSEYKAVDIEYFLNDIKKQYIAYLNIEVFIDASIVLNDLGFKSLLRILLFSHKLLNKIKYKENINCFISIYKKDQLNYYKIYLNKEIELGYDLVTFLKDRSLNYSIEKQTETGIIIEIIFNK